MTSVLEDTYSPETVSNRKPPLVIYHSPCLDGFTAAWACWLKYPDAEFVPGVYGQDPPDVTGRDVFLLDFSYKRPVMEKLIKVASSVLILDHHKSAQEDLVGLDNWLDGDTVNVIFDMTKSGARLAWDYFHPEPMFDSSAKLGHFGTTCPVLIDFVEDRDLGHLWQECGPTYPETAAITAALFSYEYDFQTWSSLSVEIHSYNGFYRLVEAGEAIERKQAKDVRELVKNLRHTICFKRIINVNWTDGKGERWSVPIANLPYTYASDAANLMSEGAPFAATYYQDADGQFVFSLRSKEDGVDVSEIAVKYGGGGHKHAAGFRIDTLEDL